MVKFSHLKGTTQIKIDLYVGLPFATVKRRAAETKRVVVPIYLTNERSGHSIMATSTEQSRQTVLDDNYNDRRGAKINEFQFEMVVRPSYSLNLTTNGYMPFPKVGRYLEIT